MKLSWNPRFLSNMASFDEASPIHESLAAGGIGRDLRERQLRADDAPGVREFQRPGGQPCVGRSVAPRLRVQIINPKPVCGRPAPFRWSGSSGNSLGSLGSNLGSLGSSGNCRDWGAHYSIAISLHQTIILWVVWDNFYVSALLRFFHFFHFRHSFIAFICFIFGAGYIFFILRRNRAWTTANVGASSS